jgi:DNA-binding transcriptional LysR family regulator
MIIDSFNLSLLRIFEAVYRTESMTLAAKELHQTQSGISQSIKNLENALGVVLFDRLRQRLIPTTHAEELYKSTQSSLMKIEESLIQIKGELGEVKGQLKIGLPTEFGNNIILPLLAEIAETHPKVSFQISYALPKVLGDLLLNSKIDFAFVDSYSFDSAILTEKVSDEELLLCCSKNYHRKIFKDKTLSKTNYLDFDYVAYDQDCTMIDLWLSHHLGIKKHWITPKMVLPDVRGVLNMILSSMGLGILPGHVLDSRPDLKSKLFVIEGKEKILKNQIALATLKDKTQSHVQRVLIQILKERLNTSL